ncbi:hypothetical protein Bhyg_04416, partial [Pseudolycoriella hygida]
MFQATSSIITEMDDKFEIENQVIYGPSTFHGRPITEKNIHEYVSDFTIRTMKMDIPLWQVILIPLSPGPSNPENNKYYILVRVHHLLLAEEPNLRMSDFLLATTLRKKVKDTVTMDFNEPLEPCNNFVPKRVSEKDSFLQTNLKTFQSFKVLPYVIQIMKKHS